MIPKGCSLLFAETETKFESPKSYPLFQNHKTPSKECAKSDGSVRTAEGIGVQLGDGRVRTVGGSNTHSNTTTITDGSSNTILFGEEQQPAQETKQPSDGSVQTGGLEVQLGDGSVRAVGDSDTSSNTTTVTDGSSNTILIGEEQRSTQETEQSAEGTTDQNSGQLFQDISSGTPITSRSDISGGTTTEQPVEAESADDSAATVDSSDATAEATTNTDDVSADPA